MFTAPINTHHDKYIFTYQITYNFFFLLFLLFISNITCRLEKGIEGHRLFAQAKDSFTLGPPPRHRIPLVFLTKLPDRDYKELDLDEKDIVSLEMSCHPLYSGI